MPRPHRATPGGYCYHVLNRGNARQRVFHKDDDDAAFLKIVDGAHERCPIRLLASCLMPNHVHFVLWPRADIANLGLESTLRPRGRPRKEKENNEA